MPGLGELFIQLGVVADTKQLESAEKKLTEFVKTGQKAVQKINDNINANENFQNKLKDVGTALTAVIGALTAAGYALNRLTNDLVQSNQAMLNLTRTSDISLSTFQKWDSIGKMLGVDNAAQQLEGLNQRLFELRLTGQGARGFQLAGINPTGDADDVMEQLRARVSGMSDTSASYLLREMGLDPQMLHLLRMGREEFEELGKTVKKYQLTNDQSKDIQRMNAQLKRASIQLQYLKDRAVLAIMPYWVDFVKHAARIAEMLARAGKAVGEFVIKWRGLIAGLAIGANKFIKLEGVIKKLLLPFRNIQAVLLKTLRLIPQIGPSLARAAAGFLRFGAVINKALLPLTAAFLILDDLAVFFSGGKSLIGQISEWGETQGAKLSEAFKKMFGGDFLGGLEDLIADMLDIIKDISFKITEFVTKFLGIPWEMLPGIKNKDARAEYGKPINRKSLNINNNKPLSEDLLPIPKSQKQAAAQEIYRKLLKLQNAPFNTAGDNMRQMHRFLMSPKAEYQLFNNNISKDTNNTNSMNVSMTNNIQTNQPAYDIERELRYINRQFT